MPALHGFTLAVLLHGFSAAGGLLHVMTVSTTPERTLGEMVEMVRKEKEYVCLKVYVKDAAELSAYRIQPCFWVSSKWAGLEGVKA